jgi:hypothetical protein
MKQSESFLFYTTVFLIHIFCSIKFLGLDITSFIIKTYFLLYSLHIISSSSIFFINKLQKTNPFLFLAVNCIKIIIYTTFLVLISKKNSLDSIVYITHFFIPYFIFLAKELFENKKKLKTKNND